ncbi:MAG TPA: hypothetical protein PK598_10580, partial [Thermoanaerobaculia bacterium]|nr:hypothetical protein [Thermoanaerobaculia bacterium]
MLADAFLSLVRKATRELDVEEIRGEVAALVARTPGLPTRERAERMVQRAARRAAVLGALASLPPGWAAVAAVAPELSALIVLQSRLIVGLHLLYGGTPEPDERALEVLAGVAAGAGINVGRRLTARAAEEVAGRIALRIAGREATRFVPLAGAAASAALNYA